MAGKCQAGMESQKHFSGIISQQVYDFLENRQGDFMRIEATSDGNSCQSINGRDNKERKRFKITFGN